MDTGPKKTLVELINSYGDAELDEVMADPEKHRQVYDSVMHQLFPEAKTLDTLRTECENTDDFVTACASKWSEEADPALATGILKGFMKSNLRRSKAKHLQKQPRDIGRSRNKNYHVLAAQKISRDVRKLITSRKWTEEEDKLLRAEMLRLTDAGLRFNDWTAYSVDVFKGTRTPRECMIRVRDTIIPTKSGEWNEDEVRRLIESVKKYGTSNWVEVADSGKFGRSTTSCRDKWRKIVKNVVSRQNKRASEVTPDYLLSIIASLSGPNTK